MKPSKKTVKLIEASSVFLETIFDPNMKLGEEKQSRSKFVEGIETILIGASGEFYKCRLYDKLAELKLIQPSAFRSHWEKEWKSHLGPVLSGQLLRRITFADREKAVKEAINDHRHGNKSFWTFAVNSMAKYFSLNPNQIWPIITDKDISDFYDVVDQRIRATLDGAKAMEDVAPELPWDNKPRKKKSK
jgi:hypothetical protein